ncbi:MAG: hypothetical protein HZB26_19960 [Candidatus Hydrogenedentes bacterium]|nr:hypothetical protein [Candidatus Hydrogenedentota bacterium]
MPLPRRVRSKTSGKPGERSFGRSEGRSAPRAGKPSRKRSEEYRSPREDARPEEQPTTHAKARTEKRYLKRSGERPVARYKGPTRERVDDQSAEHAATTPVARPSSRSKGRPNVRLPIRPAGAAAVRVQWLGFRPMFDFWGKEIKRFFQLETLANATERMIERGGDKFIVASVQRALGPSPVVSLAFELFQEGQFQLIFRLRATNDKRKQAVLGFVVAKKEGEFSKLAGIEHSNLKLLHARAPEFIVTPYQGGTIFLPDRLQREGKGREVYAYLTQWQGTYHELGVGKNHQFYINVVNPQSLSIAQTEELKGQMVEIVARSYDPAKRTCMEMPQIASGDFVVTKPGQGPLKLKVIACRNLLRNVTPPKLIDQIVAARWEWAGRPFRLAPEYPETFFEGLSRAVGKDVARAWLVQYRRCVEDKKYPERHPLKREALDELGIGLS